MRHPGGGPASRSGGSGQVPTVALRGLTGRSRVHVILDGLHGTTGAERAMPGPGISANRVTVQAPDRGPGMLRLLHRPNRSPLWLVGNDPMIALGPVHHGGYQPTREEQADDDEAKSGHVVVQIADQGPEAAFHTELVTDQAKHLDAADEQRHDNAG